MYEVRRGHILGRGRKRVRVRSGVRALAFARAGVDRRPGTIFFWREAAFVHAHSRAVRSQLRAELPAPTHLLPGDCLADFPASAPSLNESIVTVGGSEMDTNGHTGD